MLLLFIAPNVQVGVSLGLVKLIVCVSGSKGVSITVPLTIYICCVCFPDSWAPVIHYLFAHQVPALK